MKNPLTFARTALASLRASIDAQTESVRAMERSVAIAAEDIAAISARQDALLAELRRQGAAAFGAALDLRGTDAARYRDPLSLTHAPGQVYSQVNEDGILAEIFRRIGETNRQFVEIAAGDGIENTTRLLLDLGWSGLWVEAGDKEAASIRAVAGSFIDSGALTFIDSRIDRENVRSLVAPNVDPEPDLLSLDIDYNTSHIWRAMDFLRPRVVCIEYNGHYPPSVAYEVPYQADGAWQGTTRFGASLKALELIGRDKGYSLVACDGHGVNAFFVRDDLCNAQRFQAPFTAEHHYEPPRYASVHMRGHDRHG
ncbi:hypothetical protein [Mesorhizobium sp. CAU 1741]|uniref:hypothetical protein n=1 Tax=Mesorhizobium sp. CAU 1741 TaxID=3140366 RepID=UPI00325A815B